MCPSDLQQLWKEVSGVPSSEEALKQAEGLDLSTNSSNSTSAFPKAANAHIPLHNLPNGQNHTPKRDRYEDFIKKLKKRISLSAMPYFDREVSPIQTVLCTPSFPLKKLLAALF